MKKLVMFASAAAVACSLQAGSFVWGFSGGADDPAGATGWMESGATALLYLGTVSFDASSGWNTAGATFVASAGFDTVTQMGFGNLDEGNMSTSDDISVAGGQAYTLILVDADGVTGSSLAGYTGDGKHYYIATGTSIGKVLPGMGTADTPFASLDSSDFVYSTMWQSAATSGGGSGGGVPEPTSGLLLALGGAMLALRRKRA